jgi:inorganic triphosphatase YgiF
VEIEAKFLVPDYSTFVQLSEMGFLAGLRLGPARVQPVHDRYLDTADAAILRAGYACRLRTVGEGTLVTLKSLTPASDALHQRKEIEAYLGSTEDAELIDLWPSSEASELVRVLSAGQPLELLFELKQERSTKLAARPDQAEPVVAISLDCLRFDENDPPIYELEAELLPAGRLSDLDGLIADLTARWALQPQAISKFERGLARCCPALTAALARQRELG